MQEEYKFISLGYNCFVRRILTDYGLKPTKETGELSYPWDLCVSDPSLFSQAVRTNFAEYFSDIEYDEQNYIFVNKKYNIYYLHDMDCKTIDELQERYKNRILNFENLQNLIDTHLYFTLCPDKNTSQFDINNILLALNEKFKNNKFTLIVFNLFNLGLFENDRKIKIINLPFPYKNYDRIWYSKKIRKFHEGTKFFDETANQIKRIVRNDGYNIIEYPVKNITKPEITLEFADFKNINIRDSIIFKILKTDFFPIIADLPDIVFYVNPNADLSEYKDCKKVRVEINNDEMILKCDNKSCKYIGKFQDEPDYNRDSTKELKDFLYKLIGELSI